MSPERTEHDRWLDEAVAFLEGETDQAPGSAPSFIEPKKEPSVEELVAVLKKGDVGWVGAPLNLLFIGVLGSLSWWTRHRIHRKAVPTTNNSHPREGTLSSPVEVASES